MKYRLINNIKKYLNSEAYLAVSSSKLRAMFLALGFLIIYFIILIRVVYLSVSDEYSIIQANFRKNITRGNIVDRNGKVLATSIPAYSISANPKKVVDKKNTVALINSVVSINKHIVTKDLINNEKTFVWIKRGITPSQKKQIEDIGIPGIEFQSENKRVYPYKNITSHIIGYTGIDNEGLSGIEKYHDEVLISLNEEQKNVQLSIDIDIQSIVSEELESSIKEFNALAGAGVVADLESGEVLAMVSKPDFNPHNSLSLTSNNTFPMASLGVYEIGSVFKPVLIGVAFDTKTASMSDVYNLANFTVGKLLVKDYRRHDGWRTIPEIFIHSSNIGMAQIALETGQKNISSYMKNLGLFDKLSLEIPENGAPIIPKQKEWSDISIVTMSYGYAISITPAHFVQSMVPLLNGGKFFPLTLIKDKNKNNDKAKIVMSESVSKEMRKLFRLNVVVGTGKKSEVKGYLVGGKTGTANKIKNGKYSQNNRMSSFIAAFPSHNPKYLIYILLDDPKGNQSTYGFATAGYTVAPCVSRIISRMAGILNMAPFDEDDEEIKNDLHINYKIDKET